MERFEGLEQLFSLDHLCAPLALLLDTAEGFHEHKQFRHIVESATFKSCSRIAQHPRFFLFAVLSCVIAVGGGLKSVRVAVRGYRGAREARRERGGSRQWHRLAHDGALQRLFDTRIDVAQPPASGIDLL
jgi:hypothetical protein